MDLSGPSLKFLSSRYIPIIVYFNDTENNSHDCLGDLDSMSVSITNVVNTVLHISTLGTQTQFSGIF